VRFRGPGARLVAVALLGAAIAVAGCGGSSKTSAGTATSASSASTESPEVPRVPPKLVLSIAEAGKTSKFEAPASIAGGLVTVQLTNPGKARHGAQLIRIEGSHSIEEAVKAIGGESQKTPEWVRAEGGVGQVPSEATDSAIVNLPVGKYAIVDLAGARESGGPPAIAPLTVTAGGRQGSVPKGVVQVTAANPSKDHYKWEISGPLKAGGNALTFVSKGEPALHELSAIRITHDEPTATIVKALESNGPPPSWMDPSTGDATAALDGGKSLNTFYALLKPGKYVFVCHLRDRDGGKPHFAEGLLKTVTVH
jgi:hypothetical protein